MSSRNALSVVRENIRSLASGIRFGKFVSVGVVGALCDTFVLLVLTSVFDVVAELATIAGIETAILVMFAINERWTFSDAGNASGDSLLRRVLRSHVVRAGGSTTQFVIFVVVFRYFHVQLSLAEVGPVAAVASTLGVSVGTLAAVDLWLLVSKGTGIGFGMLVNYVFESLFTWRVHQDDPR
ncbi:GtrA family protein [Haloarculaceae archaeon H-GB2-1]|nr:GtrA family protein [Haloarculaceae archaeon H-GB1-1]MEA5386460.1 GtrA family protein [Haloarculaceae archaeon H-GB11]MEA5407972.1 GtrA family protein [Haloarculaceae archaeon H-GB2-1]